MKSTCRAGLLATLTMVQGVASAMGIGEIDSQSSLGQPLEVLIPLSADEPDDLIGVTARIARDELYEHNGLIKAPLLDRAEARVIDNGGRRYVEIRTREPVREPILDLMVEVVGMDGTTLRRVYGVLLDPPDANGPVRVARDRTLPAAVPVAPAVAPAPAAPASVPVVAAQVRDKATVHPARRHQAAAAPVAALPVALDARGFPQLYPPVLRMSERLEHPPAIAAAPAPVIDAPAVAVNNTAATVAPTVPAAPAVAASPRSSGRLFDVVSLGLGGLLMLLGALFLRRRRKAPNPHAQLAKMIRDLHQQPAPERVEPAPAEAPPPPAKIDYVPRPREIQVQAEAPLEENPDQALNFYRDVANLLIGELEKDPKRRDLRYKLIEVYYAANYKEEFREQTRFYLEQLQGRADEYWPEIVRMGRQLLPDSGLYSDAPQLMSRTVVQALPVVASKAQTFQRFYEAVNQAKLSARQAELETAWDLRSRDPAFQKLFAELLLKLMSRPTPLQIAESLSTAVAGATILRKFEDRRTHDDTALINAAGQVLLAHLMRKKRVVAATLEGGHGIAVAVAARELGLECAIYMKDSDQGRNPGQVRRMHELGASVITVQPSMVASSDDVRIRALDDWMQDGDTTLYINSVDAGPYPYPSIVLHLQGYVGREVRAQMVQLAGRAPDAIVVGTGDGLSAIGMLESFLAEKNIALYCVETSVLPDRKKSRHRFTREHSWLRISGRVTYVTVAAGEAERATADARKLQSWTLDLPAGEVLAQACKVAASLGAGKSVLVVLPKPEEALAESAGSRVAG